MVFTTSGIKGYTVDTVLVEMGAGAGAVSILGARDAAEADDPILEA